VSPPDDRIRDLPLEGWSIAPLGPTWPFGGDILRGGPHNSLFCRRKGVRHPSSRAGRRGRLSRLPEARVAAGAWSAWEKSGRPSQHRVSRCSREEHTIVATPQTICRRIDMPAIIFPAIGYSLPPIRGHTVRGLCWWHRGQDPCWGQSSVDQTFHEAC
jgi:hypothetical protein